MNAVWGWVRCLHVRVSCATRTVCSERATASPSTTHRRAHSRHADSSSPKTPSYEAPAPTHAVQVRKLACCSQRSDFVLACWLVQVARMFSVLSTTQKEWMATGWDEDYISKFKSAWGGL